GSSDDRGLRISNPDCFKRPRSSSTNRAHTTRRNRAGPTIARDGWVRGYSPHELEPAMAFDSGDSVDRAGSVTRRTARARYRYRSGNPERYVHSRRAPG